MPERDAFIAKMTAVHFVRLMGEFVRASRLKPHLNARTKRSSMWAWAKHATANSKRIRSA